MKPSRTRKYSWLAAFLTSLLLFSVGMLIYEKAKQEQLASVKEQSVYEVAVQADLLSKWAELRMAELNVMANTDTIRSGVLERQLSYLKREIVRLQPEYYRIGISDLTGRMTLTSGEVINASDQPGFREAVKGQSTITEPARDGVFPDDFLVFVRVPYFDKLNRVAGIVGASFRVEEFFEKYFDFKLAPHQMAYFIDSSGRAYSVSERGKAMLIENPPPGLANSVARSQGGLFELAVDGESRQVVHAAVKGTSWHIAVSVPSRELLAPSDQLRNRLIVSFALLELLLLALIYIYHGKIDHHIRMLTSRLARMSYAARHDSLTTLPNRMLLMETLEGLTGNPAGGVERCIGVSLIDLDRFKNINDTLGHNAGDQCLVQAARLLTEHLKPRQTLFRLGGDEFVLLFEDLADTLEGVAETERLLGLLNEPIRVMDHEFVLSGSAGISFYPLQASNGNELLRNADMAMYQAKQNGGGYCAQYEVSMGEQRNVKVQIEQLLRKAVAGDELRLVYQPIVPLAAPDEEMHVEALVRWNSPELGMVRPDIFIPVAEDTGIILKIGEWVLRRACFQLREWQERQLPVKRISVNISAIQLAQPGFVKLVCGIVKESGCDPRGLMLEVTESAVISRLDAASKTLTELAELGVRIALDDFGTGYSSLSSLHQLDIQVLKIDRSFIARTSKSSKDEALLGIILSIARRLGMDAVAEGVETQEQLAALQELGCGYAQGYLFSKPLKPSELVSYVLAERGGV